MSMQQMEEQVRAFLAENFIFDSPLELGSEDSLMENGVVDSTGILEVIMWVESTFGVQVEDSEVLPENFDSIGNITRYARRKMATQPGDCGGAAEVSAVAAARQGAGVSLSL